MFRIHIARNRQPLGQFSPEEVSEGLKTGRFLPTDLAWREPMDAWKPLGEFDDLPEVADPDPELAPPFPVVETVLPATPEPAWERAATLGFWKALVETFRQIFAAPVQTFRASAITPGYRRPLLFFTLIATLAIWVAFLYRVAIGQVNPEALAPTIPKGMSQSDFLWSQASVLPLVPLLVMIGAAISAAVFHGLLSVMGGATKSFEATFRAFCYAGGAASLVQFIPVCGGMLFFFLFSILMVIALRETHQVSTAKATIGVVIPMLFCCGLMLGLTALVIGLAPQALAK
ncbi:MAG: hypothetical protein BGO12_01930 [Verrucomicrobia bacterium 61-8]|nr:YIP1 family protein [Verrucomicrobiota bacterium]OJV02846.1 MAG: hypothetical protein BGO12_01930 [Verrucomicrobia bacterium 61-8]